MKLSIICILFLAATAGIGISCSPSRPAGPHNLTSERISKAAPHDHNTPKDGNGPTVLLGYSQAEAKENPISSFMYFVPLLSVSPVEIYTTANNAQQVGIISYERKMTSKSFNVACEFEILGKGFHKNTFDPAGMIAAHTDEMKEGKSLTNMLDYIKFEGEGFGRIEAKGTMAGSVPTVTEVDLEFNAKGSRSPVTVGLYDVEPADGQYKYENRSNPKVARVNALIFKRSDKPRMGMRLASISTTEKSDDFMGDIKALIANLFISPTPVDKLGNDTMLDFGRAVFQKEPDFTFPKAKNIKETRVVPADTTQN
jgi:hypothetical protein